MCRRAQHVRQKEQSDQTIASGFTVITVGLSMFIARHGHMAPHCLDAARTQDLGRLFGKAASLTGKSNCSSLKRLTSQEGVSLRFSKSCWLAYTLSAITLTANRPVAGGIFGRSQQMLVIAQNDLQESEALATFQPTKDVHSRRGEKPAG